MRRDGEDGAEATGDRLELYVRSRLAAVQIEWKEAR